jgi:pyrimidine-nucleoside phosphorylase
VTQDGPCPANWLQGGSDLDVLELIERKKRGGSLTAGEIAELVAGFTRGQVPDYQMAAFLMAVWFRSLDGEETVALTRAMLESGARLDPAGFGGPTADKHSTGGVGDKVSLLLAPLAASCGLKVPMLSGRGLGHTGGTLDKLEAIPGYRVDLENDEFLLVVQEVGCAIIGQGPDIAPADGKLYALRDVTGTIDCVPLITASILSKKLAAGPRTIVIDLKIGSGAFMPDLDRARLLARTMMATAREWDRRLSVVFSDMSQPLGRAVGHANEAIEAFAALRPSGRAAAPRDLRVLTEELTAEMVRVSGLAPGRREALALVRARWESGEAFERLQRWVAAQGGRLDPGRDDFGLELAPALREVVAPQSGIVSSVDCRAVGAALGDLGGARRRLDERPDLGVGLDFLVSVGQSITAGEPLAILRARTPEAGQRAADRLLAAVHVGDEPTEPIPLIQERLAK